MFWPNSVTTYALSLFGLVYLLFYWRKSLHIDSGLVLKQLPRTGLAAVMLAGYLLLPVWFLADAEKTNSHYIGTLRHVEQRSGKYIELDRVVFSPVPTSHIQTDTGESIRVRRITETMPRVISLQGQFINAGEIEVKTYRTHAGRLRDGISYLGLLLVLLLWATVLGREALLRLRQTVT